MHAARLLAPGAVLCAAAFAQTYTIQTFAGGGLPQNIAGTSASLGFVTGVALDANGNVFMSLLDYDVVLRLDAQTGKLSVVAGNGTPGFSGDNGFATAAQLSGPFGIAVDGSGNVYIADSANNRIRKVSNSTITTVVGGGANGVSLSAPTGVAVDSSGNLYIADYGNNRVLKFSGGTVVTVAGNGTAGFSGDNGPATSAELDGPYSIAVDTSGNLYIGDVKNNRVRKVSGGVITTVAGNGTPGASGDNGPATSAEIANPFGLALDAAGHLYISDGLNNRVRVVSNGTITTVAGSTSLNQPEGLAVDRSGNLYVSDGGNRRIAKIANGVITTIAGGGSPLGDNGPAPSAQLYEPFGTAVDAAGDVYIADTKNYRIRKVAGAPITTVAGKGTSGFSGDNGPATSAELSNPHAVAVDASGNIYIADGSRVRMVSKGVITTIAGNGSSAYSGDNGPAVDAGLGLASGVAVDASGNVYIADSVANRVRKVSAGTITTVAGNGIAGFSGDNGPATGAELNNPLGVAVDSAGNLYVADSGNNRVRKALNGAIITVAGGGSVLGDGLPGDSALLNLPTSVAVDANGNLYITDSGNQRIRRISGGVIATIAGTGQAGFVGDTGGALNAELDAPNGVSVDASGRVYFADSFNHRVRELVPSGASCSYSVSPLSLNAATSGGHLTVTIQTAAGCPWEVSDLPQWITVFDNTLGSGPTTVTLVVGNYSGPARSATIDVAGFYVEVAQQGTVPAPSINASGVVNVASYATGVAPGSIAAAFGDFLITTSQSDSSLPLLTSMQGLSLQFYSLSAFYLGPAIGPAVPLFFVSNGQVNFQVPWELQNQTQPGLVASLNSQNGLAQTVAVALTAPGIFSTNAKGTGQGAILDTSYRLVDSSHPVTAGSVVFIYCTGLGAVTNQPGTGSPASANPVSKTLATPTVTIGGAAAEVLFSGLAPGFVGLYQVNAKVPATSTTGPAVPVVMTLGTMSNTVTMAVQ